MCYTPDRINPQTVASKQFFDQSKRHFWGFQEEKQEGPPGQNALIPN